MTNLTSNPLLATPITAYFVSADNIVPFTVKNRFVTQTTTFFLTGRAIWVREGVIQWPLNNKDTCLRVNPSSNPQRPFEHKEVAHTIEDAVELLKEKRLAQARRHRMLAACKIKKAEALEQTNCWDLVFPKSTSAIPTQAPDNPSQPAPAPYVSPFTGETQ